jgi:hypothetical protein
VARSSTARLDGEADMVVEQLAQIVAMPGQGRIST